MRRPRGRATSPTRMTCAPPAACAPVGASAVSASRVACGRSRPCGEEQRRADGRGSRARRPPRRRASRGRRRARPPPGRVAGVRAGKTARATPAALATASAPPTRVVFFVAKVGKPRSSAASARRRPRRAPGGRRSPSRPPVRRAVAPAAREAAPQRAAPRGPLRGGRDDASAGGVLPGSSAPDVAGPRDGRGRQRVQVQPQPPRVRVHLCKVPANAESLEEPGSGGPTGRRWRRRPGASSTVIRGRRRLFPRQPVS